MVVNETGEYENKQSAKKQEEAQKNMHTVDDDDDDDGDDDDDDDQWPSIVCCEAFSGSVDGVLDLVTPATIEVMSNEINP